MTDVNAGLEDMVVAQHDICFIHDEMGELVYRGYHIDELVPKATYEEIVYLRWHNKLPNQKELDDLKERLVIRRALNVSE